MRFRYFNPVRIYFNVSFIDILKEKIKKDSMILTTNSFLDKAKALRKEINAKKILIIPPNPQLDFILQMWEQTRRFNDIVALGGGSVIDSAKAFCLQVSFAEFENLLKFGKLDSKDSKNKNSAHSKDCKNIESSIKKSDIYAIPTTSGSGSELTPWATIWDKKKNKKYSLHLDDLYCKCAIYDISLLTFMPRNLSIYTALDALSHSIESIWNKNANPISTQYACGAIKLILTNLPKLVKLLDSIESISLKGRLDSKKSSLNYKKLGNIESKINLYSKIYNKLKILRETIALASIYAALAFSNTKTALAHAISYPLSMKFDMPHGLACSFTLPLLLECLLSQDSMQNLESSSCISSQNVPDSIKSLESNSHFFSQNTQDSTQNLESNSYFATKKFIDSLDSKKAKILDSNIDSIKALKNAQKILKPYQKPLINLFKTLNISTDFKSYNITKADINEIFSSLNTRADNFLLDSNIVKNHILHRI
ncbi:iron-containing alcohol dehydrogenase [Helicobacter saguini]|uniref:Iron-containing alcohol dehydrogenase n=1 Tax=Helicobacter saguini TaxID=1548018 RepID=A0A347VV15_9HELI|nr:iron-containing alcohol dehydrogenase [Helicobacter saguini]MWV62614.1 iron-containing alcohol dehydrogenase [Helicobacter saguini]MWV66714.1 iron-containing alcohol dehydrogenase [Helicobacter saguini]MWV69064.1 iron-containing alcohol dehydrogenase [Helicobacter saguini]MWV71382.1 iron-containing alcohol dehydrogenase [Helicobacter saguini]TLD94014.1 iron-containing alcohol dehydrogenase [Helicobacter saguini]